MKLVLLKKLRQSQMMKENVCVPPSPNSVANVNNGIGSSLSITGTNYAGSLPPPQSPHQNNHLGIPNLHGASLQSGVKGRSSPKLPSGTNLSLNPSHGTPMGHLGNLAGLRLTQHGIPSIGIPPQQGPNNSHHRPHHGSPNKGLNSSKVPSFLKGVMKVFSTSSSYPV